MHRFAASRAWLVGALFIFGASLAWWSMPNGAVPANDSFTYLGVARNVEAGFGLTSPFSHELSGLSPDDSVSFLGREPMTVWPPLYPLALAGASILPPTIESAARLINVVGLGLAVALTGLMVLRVGGRTATAALVSMVFALGISTVTIFAIVGSEPLYLGLQLGGLIAASSLARRVTVVNVASFVALAAAAALTRYVGVAVIGAGVLAIAFTASPDLRGRHRDVVRRIGLAVGVGVLAVAPVAFWSLRVRGEPGFHGGLVYHGRLGDLTQTFRAMGGWLIPQDLVSDWRVPVLIVFAGLVGFASMAGLASVRDQAHAKPKAGRTEPDLRLVAVLIAHVILYEVMVIASASFVDHGIPLGFRLTLPLAPTLLAIIGAGTDVFLRSVSNRSFRTAVSAVAVGAAVTMICLQARDSYDRVLSRSPAGLWSEFPTSPTIEAVRSLPNGTLVFTNQPSEVYALTSRPVLALPIVKSPRTGANNPAAARDLDQLATILETKDAVVVFDPKSAYFTGGIIVSEQGLRARLDLEVIAEDPDFRMLRSHSSE